MNTPTFPSRQARFVEEYLVDCNGAAAAVRAGYAAGSAKVAASRMLTFNNPVRLAIQGRQEADAARLGVTREGVMQRFLEAFELAKEAREPLAMVAAARELGRMLGFYAPVRVEAVVDVEGLAIKGQFERMSDAQLLALVGGGPQG